MYILEITKVKTAKNIVEMETNWALGQTQANYTHLHLAFLGKNMPCHLLIIKKKIDPSGVKSH